jgi:hypothetical protein
VIPLDSSQQQSTINNTNHQGSRNCHSPQLTTSHSVYLPFSRDSIPRLTFPEAIGHYPTNQTINNKSSPYGSGKRDNVRVYQDDRQSSPGF